MPIFLLAYVILGIGFICGQMIPIIRVMAAIVFEIIKSATARQVAIDIPSINPAVPPTSATNLNMDYFF